jgi:hypothetical protein
LVADCVWTPSARVGRECQGRRQACR